MCKCGDPDCVIQDDNDEDDLDDPEDGMRVSGWACDSCACHEIHELRSGGKAHDAMKRFCEQTLGTPSMSKYGRASAFEPLATHYLFIAGSEKDGHAYGTEFAKFIVDHKLGDLVTLPPKLNIKHHPGTTCQVWLWQPDQKSVEAWWGVFHKDTLLKLETELKSRKEAEAKEKATLAKIGTYIVGPSIGKVIAHLSATPYSGNGGSKAVDNFFIPFVLEEGYPGRYKHKVSSGGTQVTDAIKFVPKLGTAYKILSADHTYWEIAELFPPDQVPDVPEPVKKGRKRV